jgi:hypothetical protein
VIAAAITTLGGCTASEPGSDVDALPEEPGALVDDVGVLQADLGALPDDALLALLEHVSRSGHVVEGSRVFVPAGRILAPGGVPAGRIDDPAAYVAAEPSASVALGMTRLGIASCRITREAACPEALPEATGGAPATIVIVAEGMRLERTPLVIVVGLSAGTYRATGFEAPMTLEGDQWIVERMSQVFSEN